MNNVIKNAACFVNGTSYIGEAEDLTPPKLTLKMEEYRGGGMDVPVEIDMGMEKMEASFVLTNFDKKVLSLFGVKPSQNQSLVFKAAGQSVDGTVTSYCYEMRGVIKEMDSGALKAGEKAVLTCSMAVQYYKLTVGKEVIHEIDAVNMTRVINGVDQLKEMREALGK